MRKNKLTEKAAKKIYLRIRNRLVGNRAADRRKEKLKKLYPGETADKLLEEYYTKILEILLKIGAAGLAAAAVALFLGTSAGKYVAGVQRNQSGGGSRYVELSLLRMDGSRRNVRLEVKERLYTEEAMQKLYREASDLAERMMPGENESLTCITGPMALPDKISGYPFEIIWQSSRPEVMGADGIPQQGIYDREEEVDLTAVFRCQDFEESRTWRIRVCFPHGTERQQWEEAVWDALQRSDAENACEEWWELPGEVAGEKVAWEQKGIHPAAAIVVLTCSCMLLVWGGRSRRLEKKLEERDAELEEEYCNVVTKLSLYLGAGMTVTGAWQKTSVSEGTGYTYEEMRFSCRELQNGVCESECYEAFGRRCGRQEYVRLGALLSQNLKKGNRELIRRMREETLRAQENQKNVARRRGEEAAAKLLIPMVMMLGMVLTMIMIPAFGSIG